MKLRVLVVDDDRQIADTVKELLQSDGLDVALAKDADRALAALRGGGIDLVVLDVGLPGFSGIQLCQHLKRQADTASLPIILLTSLGQERDKVLGLDAGADDYVTKPFSALELRARVRALLRRSQAGGGTDRVWQAKDLVLNEDTRTVQIKGKAVELRPKEFDLLAALLKKKGRVLSRQHLAETVWGPAVIATNHTITVCVANLREKLGPLAQRIIPVTGVGYKYED
ncbi:MAG TPA: response regulator transcription factor [Elusimicrobiota bacterium]|jgi:DNA-binding response OmpR family regulator|nr:response regulator transcription factor [Elusimicrobiota bacterium]